MIAKKIAFDTETGGTDPTKHPILTAYFLALDENLEKIDSLDIAIRPEAPFDEITEEALNVNGIKMEEHLARTDLVTRQEAAELIRKFVKKYTGKSKNSALPEPMGHNVQFDLEMLRNQILPGTALKEVFHYRVVDTFPISSLLKEVGLLPKEVGKLTSIAEHYGLGTSGAHDAKFDVYLCVNVYKRMVETLKALKNNAGNSSKNILELIEQ